MSLAIIKYALFAMLAYTVLPTLLARICSVGVISRLPFKKKISITFDDGPDPRYTPRVLDILEAEGVKACFFVVGEKARNYPEIIRKIMAGGHEIGSHGLKHKNPWLLGPVETVREIKHSFKAIEEISGLSPEYYRPPWGLFNLSYFLTTLFMKYKIVLWSFVSWDWTKGATPEAIISRIKKSMTDGSILIFHDSDTEPGASTGSPEKMICALPDIINEIKRRGYQITPLKELLLSKKYFHNNILLIIWRVWDAAFRRILGIYDITNENGDSTIFRISIRKYIGPGTEYCGKVLRPGDKICELHLNNDYLKNYLGDETGISLRGIRTARELGRSLPVLAKVLNSDARFKGIDFIVGISLLHRGAAAIGFKELAIKSNPVQRIIALYQGVILSLYHPLGKKSLIRKGNLEPKILVMSKKAFLNKYLNRG